MIKSMQGGFRHTHVYFLWTNFMLVIARKHSSVMHSTLFQMWSLADKNRKKTKTKNPEMSVVVHKQKSEVTEPTPIFYIQFVLH